MDLMELSGAVNSCLEMKMVMSELVASPLSYMQVAISLREKAGESPIP